MDVCRKLAVGRDKGQDGRLVDQLGRKIRETHCHAIPPYLEPDAEGIVKPIDAPLNAPKELRNGCLCLDGGSLIIEDGELQKFLDAEPMASEWIKPLVGARELLHSRKRWCLWLADAPKDVLELPLVAKRIERCRKFRQRTECSNPKAALSPHLFRETPRFGRPLVLPLVASEDRERFPVALCSEGSVIANTCHFAPDASLYHFGIASSKMHCIWINLVGGRLQGRLRYSKTLCWNAFPWPPASAKQEAEVSVLAQKVADARSEVQMSLAEMYQEMPDIVRNAHKKLDEAVDALYGIPRNAADGFRLQTIFKMRKTLENAEGDVNSPLSVFQFDA